MTLIAPPTIPAFAAGYGYTAAQMDALVQTPLTFQTAGIVARVKQSVQQTFTANTYTANTVQFGNGGAGDILEDPYGGWALVQPYSWSPPLSPDCSGWYEITLWVSNTPNAFNVQTTINVSNNMQFITTQQGMPSATFGGGLAVARAHMVGGVDYVFGEIDPSGAAKTDVSSVGRQPSMEIVYISG